MTKIVIGLMVCQILWQSRQSRFAAEVACAGNSCRVRRRTKNSTCHQAESRYGSQSTMGDWLEVASTKGFQEAPI